MIRKFILVLILFSYSIFSADANLQEPAQEVLINKIDAEVLNEACRMILIDNQDDELEDLFDRYKNQHGKPVKTTSFGVPVTAGKMMARYGHVNSQLGNGTRKVINCSWFFEDAPEEIARIAQIIVAAEQHRKENQNWFDKHVGSYVASTVKKLFCIKEPYYTTLPLPAGTYSRLQMHAEGDGRNMSSSITCTLDLAESDEDKKAALPSRVLTELLEEHVLAKAEAKKFMAEKESYSAQGYEGQKKEHAQ